MDIGGRLGWREENDYFISLVSYKNMLIQHILRELTKNDNN